MLRHIDYKWQVLAVICTGTFMVVLDTTIVNIALPHIITVFNASVDQAQLVLTGYMLSLAIIMPTTAYLTEKFGMKRLYVFTLAMFTLGSMLCGAAPSLSLLIVARVLQGLGGGMIQPLGMAALFEVARPEERGTMMGIFALPIMVAPLAGPTVGGYLVEYVDWRWIFYLNLPAGILGIVLAIMLLKESPRARGRSLDALGFLLAGAFSAGALLAASDAPQYGWTDSRVVWKLWMAAIAFPIFLWWEFRTPEPLVELRLFRIPAFSMGALVNLVTMIALYGALLLLPLFLQNLRGLGAMETGLLLLPQAIASTVSVTLGGRLYDRFGARPLVILGLLCLALSTWVLGKIDVSTSNNTIRLVLVLRGAASGLAMMPSMTAWLAAAPAAQTRAASALQNVMRQMYSAFATAAFATLLNNRQTFHQWELTTLLHRDSLPMIRLMGAAHQFAYAHSLTLAQAQKIFLGGVAHNVQLAAAVRSFDDCFLVASATCIAGMLPALFLRASRPARGTAEPVEA